MAKIDIILPTFNRPRLLDRCIRSTLALDVPGLRLVIIDDGSTVFEQLDDGSTSDTPSLVKRFSDPRLVYTRLEKNSGLGVVYETYVQRLIGAEYMTVINDDDVYVDGGPIKEAINKLDTDPALAFVQISLIRRSDDKKIDEFIALPYPTMTGADFFRRYVYEEPIKHTTMYGIFRTANVKATNALVDMHLRDYGLEDGFGIDTDFLFRMATMGNVGFVNRAHVLRRETDGMTDRYPVSFAYCYYQYILRAIDYLREKSLVEPKYIRGFVKWWMKVMLMMLSATLSDPTKRERGAERIRSHLKYPFHLYIAMQYLKFGIWPDKDAAKLFVQTLRKTIAIGAGR